MADLRDGTGGRNVLAAPLIVPNPDPSDATKDLVDREISSLSEKVTVRLDAIDAATKLFHEDLVRVPTTVDRAVGGLRELLQETMDKHVASINGEINKNSAQTEERFVRIDNQFIERDKRTDQLSLADKTAVAAALQAAKEAVGAQNTSNSIAIAKSESSTVESIKQLQTLFNSSIEALRGQVTDIKERLDRGEGHTKGLGEGWGYIVAVASLLILVAGLFLKH